ncbi:hypothetical protein GCM10028798_23670 [Humibacter antri]
MLEILTATLSGGIAWTVVSSAWMLSWRSRHTAGAGRLPVTPTDTSTAVPAAVMETATLGRRSCSPTAALRTRDATWIEHGWATNQKLAISILIGYVFLIIYELVARKWANRPRLDFFASAYWVIPWFILMFLVSWLFDPASNPSMFWVFLINLAIYIVAVKITLPTKKIEEYIGDAANESEIEEKTLAGGAIG